MVVPVETTPTFKPGRAVEAVRDYRAFTPGLGTGRNYDVSRDGQRFILSRRMQSDSGPKPTIVFVESWFDRVNQLLPPESTWFERLKARFLPAK